ncbi:MAG TPA: DNA polymerase III subunit gamma/tau [Anaerolineaceae bacterium]
MAQAFYRKWRPQAWDEVVGQDHIVQTLRNAVCSGRVGHAYLFAGPRGTGKTTTARLLAKAVNCLESEPANRPCNQCEHCKAVNNGHFMDLVEIDAASNTSVDDVRDLRDKINFAPSQGTYRVYIIDEVHMLSTAAFNALLKTLEEPPPHAIFILATTEVHKIPATVLSRCQRHEFRRIPVSEIVSLLRKQLQLERQERQAPLEVDDDALLLIARQATGSMRDGISLLDQLTSTGERVTLAIAQQVLGTATNQTVVELVEAVLAGDSRRGMQCVHQALDAGTDPRQFALQVVEYLRGVLLVKMQSGEQVDATAEMRAQMTAHARAFGAGAAGTARLVETIRLFNNAAADARGSWLPSLQLEMALTSALQPSTPVQSVVMQPPQPVSSTLRVAQAAHQSPPPVIQGGKTDEGDRQDRTLSLAAEMNLPPQGVHSSSQPAGQAVLGQSTAAFPPVEIPASAGKISLELIQQNWAKARKMVGEKNHVAGALLNSIKSMTVKEGVLVLGFASRVLKEKMESEESQKVLRATLKRLLGMEVPVRCVVSGAPGSSGSSQQEIEADGDGMASEAQELGGKIIYKDSL